MLNPLMMSGYYTALFNSFRSLLNEEDNQELEKMIQEVEDWISDDLNPLTIQEAEVRMFQNMDLLSGFEVRGVLITQQEINTRLDRIKQYLQQKLFEYLPYIRFGSKIQI